MKTWQGTGQLALAEGTQETRKEGGLSLPMRTGTTAATFGPRSIEETSRLIDSTSLRLIIDKNVDGMVVVGTDGLIRFANPSAAALLGRSSEDLVGIMFGIPMVPGETTEIDLVCPGLGPRTAEMRVVEIPWEGESAYLASLRDLTEHKMLKAALQRQVEELNDLDRRKNEFLAMLGHELRNPLAPIRNALHILGLPRLKESDRANMHAIMLRQVDRMTRLVDDLLDVARVTTGKIQLRKERIDCRTLVNHAVENLSSMLETYRHDLSVSLPLEPIWLEVDPTRLEQVLTNLIHNAIKYTEPGGKIWVTGECQGEQLILRVRDTGIGMSREMVPRIFDLFTQADGSLDRSRGGLGVGLTLARNLIEMHGGAIAAHSDGPGKGSELVVYLPLASGGGQGGMRASTQTTADSSSCQRILVVDDNMDSAQTMSLFLQLQGHRVETAYTGTTALELARANRPCLILLDIGLPDMTGYEVARQVREQPELASTILVAVTGYGQEQDRRRCQEAGFQFHLVKPVDLKIIQEIVERLPTLSTAAAP